MNPFEHIARKPLTTLQRAKLFAKHNGVCVICGAKIFDPTWIDEHILPLALGGTNDMENRGPAHVECAREKTRKDLSAAAKGKRIYAKHVGAKAQKRMAKQIALANTDIARLTHKSDKARRIAIEECAAIAERSGRLNEEGVFPLRTLANGIARDIRALNGETK